jgi:transcriptional regulator with XRE-family HTH domain
LTLKNILFIIINTKLPDKKGKLGVFVMNDEFNGEFGQRVVFVRKRLHMTQEDFAESMGISTPNLSAVESGKAKPTLELLQKISFRYQVSMDYLFRGTGDMFIDEKNARHKRDTITNIYSIEDIVRLAERSIMFRHTVIGFAASYFLANKARIEETIRKENQPPEETVD